MVSEQGTENLSPPEDTQAVINALMTSVVQSERHLSKEERAIEIEKLTALRERIKAVGYGEVNSILVKMIAVEINEAHRRFEDAKYQITRIAERPGITIRQLAQEATVKLMISGKELPYDYSRPESVFQLHKARGIVFAWEAEDIITR